MRLTLRVSPFAPLPQVAEFAARCEAAGLDGVGFLDSQMINRDVFVTLAAVAARTHRIRLITAVTNPVTRHVSVLASAAASVDDLAPGRVEIWLGRGFSSVAMAGLKQASTEALGREALALRRLLAGEWDVLPGVHSRLRIGDRRIPVYLAAAGPRTMRLAGAVADGVLLADGMGVEPMVRARELTMEGARQAGRDASTLDFCLNLLTAIRPTREEALFWAGPLLAARLEDERWLRAAGVDTHGVQMPAGLGGLYPDPIHAEDNERAMELASKVPLELQWQIANKLGLIGTPDDCLARLREYERAGFDYIFLRTIDTLSFPAAEVDAFRDVIGPALGKGPAGGA